MNLKKIGFGVGIGVAVIGLGYFGFKKLRGKKEETEFEKPENDWNVPTKEEYLASIERDKKIIKDLETLHYSEDKIEPFRKSILEKEKLMNIIF